MKHIVGALLLTAVIAVAGLAQDQKSAVPASTPAPMAEIQVCTGIADRMPTGGGTSFATDVGLLYCWSKITGVRGEATVKHIWTRDGKEMLAVDLPVKSVAWRTFSQKKILPQWTGNWEVKVVDSSGATLCSVAFTVGSPSK